MRSAGLIAALASLSLLAAGCGMTARPDAPYRLIRKAKTPVAPPPGFLYTHYKAPLDAGPGPTGTRRGTATHHQIGLPPLPFPGLTSGIDLFSWGDASIKTAAANGGIRQVRQTDYEYTVVLLIYRRFVTEVHGD